MKKIFKRRKVILYIDIIYKWKDHEVYLYLELRQRVGIFGLKKFKYTLSVPERNIDNEFTLVNRILNEEALLWGDYDKLIITRDFKTTKGEAKWQ